MFYDSYVRTYIERDVYDITKVKDFNTFFRFMVSVAARTGSVLEYQSIANDVGVSLETIRIWVSILQKTDIIFLLQPYYSSHLTRNIKSPKIYFRDTGLAAYLTSWLTPETLEHGAMNGAFFETFVINEIIKSYTNVGKDYSKYLYYYRGKDKERRKKENGDVELWGMWNRHNYWRERTLYPIEIKKTSNPSSSMAGSFDVLDKDISKNKGNGAIICLSEYKLKLKDNVFVLPIEYV